MKKFSFLLILIFFVFTTFAFSEPKLTKIGTYKCGKQPKQVLFSPDSKYIVMPLLDDNGFDVFSVEEKKMLKRINPPNAAKVGFAEGLFIPEKNVFLVSQMTTANLYEYSYPKFELLRTIPTKGVWSKFIAYSAEKNLLCVSNWVSNDISLIDYESGKLVRKIKTAAAPRGLYFSDKGENIIVLSYEGGKIHKFNTQTGAKVSEISVPKSSMRHIMVNKDESKAYVSDMYYFQIYEIDLASFKITKKVKVFYNPNTIDLLNDRWLFVSSRGPNNPKDYTKRSPQNGKITIIDTSDMSIVKTIPGGNQPTGLDLNAEGNLLCSSNFQDQNIELYSVTVE
ncbi:YncE family protein [Treponema zioleckii]|uniref:YncE family protein n=1 Tax=Treponema zioleckii TaxID=331680 RepID=UPI00168BE19F|nr:YncE family protein [Treponema zioleckii]